MFRPRRRYTVMHALWATRRLPTERARLKALEKEIPWHQTPEQGRPSYREALSKQWSEFLHWEAVAPLTLAESRDVEASVPTSHIINSRVAYRDKNVALRTPTYPVPRDVRQEWSSLVAPMLIWSAGFGRMLPL